MSDQQDITPEELANWFSYHPPTPGLPAIYTALRDFAGAFARAIVAATPAGEDQQAAVRHVREAVMTANAAIACAPADWAGPQPWDPEVGAFIDPEDYAQELEQDATPDLPEIRRRPGGRCAFVWPNVFGNASGGVTAVEDHPEHECSLTGPHLRSETWGGPMHPCACATTYHEASPELLTRHDAVGLIDGVQVAVERQFCPDGGTCHHTCVTTCYRTTACEPLLGVFPNDRWPAEVSGPLMADPFPENRQGARVHHGPDGPTGTPVSR